VRSSVISLFLLCVLASRLSPQSAADSAAIRATAHDYIDGYYSGDAARMERAIHPHLAKRIVMHDPATGRDRLGDMTAMELVQGTRRAAGEYPESARRDSVTILDIFENAAVVRVDAATWVDYLHEARWQGKWVIINVLWELRPEARGH